jgi:hypothetical protein
VSGKNRIFVSPSAIELHDIWEGAERCSSLRRRFGWPTFDGFFRLDFHFDCGSFLQLDWMAVFMGWLGTRNSRYRWSAPSTAICAFSGAAEWG